MKALCGITPVVRLGLLVALAAAVPSSGCGPRFGGFEGDPTSCSNSIDDDVDGAADCADPGCSAFCAPGTDAGGPGDGGPGACGNGVRDGAEDCDGTDFDGATCTSLGFSGGLLSCTGGCLLNTAACTGAGCGDGSCGAGETCTTCPGDCPPTMMCSGNTLIACDAGGTTMTDCALAGGPCSTGACSPTAGCITTPLAPGSICDDGLFCTVTDVCSAGGSCGGAPRDCSAFGDDCNGFTCDETANACDSVMLPNGTGCDDFDPCTMPDTCQFGVCTGGGGGGCCDPTAILLNEIMGGDAVDFIELTNSGSCAFDLGGLSLSWRLDCDTATSSFTFPPGATIAAGGLFRLVEDFNSIAANELDYGLNICDNASGGGWVALCDGPCALTTCTNFLDYFEKTGFSVPTGDPACATFTPGPLSVSGALGTQSVNRVGFLGSGASGVASDWTIATSTR